MKDGDLVTGLGHGSKTRFTGIYKGKYKVLTKILVDCGSIKYCIEVRKLTKLELALK